MERGGSFIREGMKKGVSPEFPYDPGLCRLLDSSVHPLLHCLCGARERRKFELRIIFL
jgi:hypothetical protein